MQKRAIRTKERLLKAGLKMFSRKGFAGTSVDDIATDAEANKQRIYVYYGSKKGLFQACVKETFRRVGIFSETMLAEAEANPDNLTRILLRGYCQIHEKYPEFRRLLTWANLENAIDPEILSVVRKNENDRIGKIYADLVKRGKLKDIPFNVYLLTLLSVPYFINLNGRTLAHTIGVPDVETGVASLAPLFDK